MNRRVQKHNQAINGLYWNNAALRVILEYLGAPGFPGLEPGLKRLNKSGNLYNHLLKVHPEGIIVTGPNVDHHPLMAERYELRFPAVGSWEYGVDGKFKTIYHDTLDIQGPPQELNMQLWQRDVHCLTHPKDTGYTGDMNNAKPTRTIFVVDIEYKNKASENQVITDQEGIFRQVHNVVDSIEDVLKQYGFDYLKVMTGKGYNLVGHVPSFDTAFDELVRIGGSLEPTLMFYMGQMDRSKKRLHRVPVKTELAHKGVNRIMQYVTNLGWQRYRQKGGRNHVTTKAIGDGPNVIIDQYLLAVEASMKATGIPGCPYLRFWYQDWKKGFDELQRKVLPNTCIPIRLPLGYNGHDRADIHNAVRIRNNFGEAMEFLQGGSGIIPNCSEGIKRVLHDYHESELAHLHRQMEEKPFVRYDLEAQKRQLGGRLAALLTDPDPGLNTSGGLHHFVRELNKRRWHPKDIASIIATAYGSLQREAWPKYYSYHRRAAGETERVLGEVRSGF
jgi:hypothetical protein